MVFRVRVFLFSRSVHTVRMHLVVATQGGYRSIYIMEISCIVGGMAGLALGQM
jgi:hypothetical protein